MKKLLVLATIAGLVGFSLVASFAQEVRVQPSKSIPKLVIRGVSIQKIISVENDKSQPPDSLIQRYRVAYVTTKEKSNTMTVQVDRDKMGEILKASIVSGTKAGGGMFSPVIGGEGCDDSCDFRCILILDMRTGSKTYWCFWVGGNCDDC